jgi:hypothetical protein
MPTRRGEMPRSRCGVEEVLRRLLDTQEEQDRCLFENRETISRKITLGIDQLDRGERIKRIFDTAASECQHEIASTPDKDDEQRNECRDSLLAYIKICDVPNGGLIATKLQAVTTNKSGLGLLVCADWSQARAGMHASHVNIRDNSMEGRLVNAVVTAMMLQFQDVDVNSSIAIEQVRTLQTLQDEVAAGVAGQLKRVSEGRKDRVIPLLCIDCR